MPKQARRKQRISRRTKAGIILIFAPDSKEKGIMKLLNAPEALTSTIAVNPQGIVTYNAQLPLTFEKPEALYKQAPGNS